MIGIDTTVAEAADLQLIAADGTVELELSVPAGYRVVLAATPAPETEVAAAVPPDGPL